MNKTQGYRKICRNISAALVVALLIGFIPGFNTAAAADTLSGELIEYDFRLGAYQEDVIAGRGEDAKAYTNYGDERQWAYVSDNLVSEQTIPIGLLSDFTQVFSERGEWLAYRITVPADGRYRMGLSCLHRNAAAIMDVFAIRLTQDTDTDKDSISSYLTSDNKLGTVDAYSDEQAVMKKQLGEKGFEAGEYLLVFQAKADSPFGRQYLYPAVFTLDGTSLLSVSLNIGNTDIDVGQTTRAACVATMSDGRSTSEVDTVFACSNPDVATVDENGVILGQKAGNTIITCEVTVSGVTKTANAELTVSPETPYSGVVLNYEFKLSAQYAVDTKYSDTNDTWKYAGNSAGWTPSADNRKLSDCVQFKFEADMPGSWAALELDIPTAGRYSAVLTYRTASSGAIAGTYFMPATGIENVDAGLIEDNLLGEVSFRGSSSGDNTIKLNDIRARQPGKYYLVFRYVPGQSRMYIFPGMLTLDGVQLSKVNLITGRTAVGEYSTAASSVIAELANGEKASDVSVAFTSDNPNVAAVDENTGVITGISEGVARITVTAERNGAITTDTKQIQVVTRLGYQNNVEKITTYSGAYSDVDNAQLLSGFTDYGDAGRNWRYAFMNCTDNTHLENNKINCVYATGGAKLGEYMAFSVNITQSGVFKPVLEYYGYNRTGIVGVYLLALPELDIDADLLDTLTATDAHKLGEVDTYNAEVLVSKAGLDETELTAGEYLLIYKAEDKNSLSSNYWMLVRELVFNGYEPDFEHDYSGETVTVKLPPSMGQTNSAAYTDINELFADNVEYDLPKRYWAYVDGTYNAGDTSGNIIGPTYIQLANMIGEWAAFKVHVPAPGTYKASITYLSQKNYGAVIGVYSAPYDESKPGGYTRGEIAALINPYNRYGQIDTRGLVSELRTTDIDEMTFEQAGSYFIIFRGDAIGRYNYSGNGTNMYIQGLMLDGIALNTVEMEIDNDRLGTGDIASLTVSAKNSDGSGVADFTKLFSSSDENIAVVDPETGTVTAKAPGSVKITVRVSAGGVSKSTSIVITVGHFNISDQGALLLTVLDSAGGSVDGVSIIRDESTPEFIQGQKGFYDLGTEFSVTAPDVSGKKFLYWKNTTSKRICATSPTLTFRIGSDTQLTAVYKDTDSGVLVEFIDRNGKVLESALLDNTVTSISAPEAFSVGYEFRNWAAGSLTILSGETVTKSQINSKDTFFIAQYGEQESTQYNVTVSGSTQDGVSPYTYNSKVSVSAAGAPAGQSFAYWMRDGKIISYNPSYSFYVWHDTVVEAVYLPAEDIPPALPQTIMDAPKKIGDKAVFAAERTTPAGFEMIESGILLTDNAVNATGSTFNTETPGVIKAIAQSGEPNGQFTARCDDADGTWYARAYMIYINVNTGEHMVVYSNIESI